MFGCLCPDSTKSGTPLLCRKAGQTGCGSCFQASAGILPQSSKLSSFGFVSRLKQLSQTVTGHNSQNVPPTPCIWPRKGGARRPRLRPLSLNRSTFNTGRTHCFQMLQQLLKVKNLTEKCYWPFCITQRKLETNQKNIIQRNHMRCTTPYCLKFLNCCIVSRPRTQTFMQQHFPAKTPEK